MISANITASLYLVTGILFIMALRGLSSPETSRTGNFLGILGMGLAVIVTLLSLGYGSEELITCTKIILIIKVKTF